MNTQKVYNLFFAIAVFFASSVRAQENRDTAFDKITALVTEYKATHAPDVRTKLFKISAIDSAAHTVHIETTDQNLIAPFYALSKDAGVKVHITALPVRSDSIGVVNLSVANLRMKKGHSSEMATQVLLGAKVNILKEEDGEYLLRTAEGYLAWTPKSSVVAMYDEEYQAWNQKPKVIFHRDFGKALIQPHQNAMRISDLVYGDILAKIGETEDYVQVEYPDKRKGYIPNGEVMLFSTWLDQREASAENILSSAQTMMGLPYLWGGTSVKAVDCSGFTKTVYFMNGLIIPRDASQQVNAGIPVDILDEQGNLDYDKAVKNLRPADLLFFAGSKATSENPRVTHVALYMGQGEFIHAAGTVRINSMNPEAPNYDDFQSRTVVAARRYLNSQDPQIQAIAQHHFYVN